MYVLLYTHRRPTWVLTWPDLVARLLHGPGRLAGGPRSQPATVETIPFTPACASSRQESRAGGDTTGLAPAGGPAA
jgi:hypothetical protein